MSPLISIIVPTRNRALMLERLLASLAALRYPSWEAIIVDDGSTDETAAVVERFRDHGLPITYRYQPWQKMGAARNLALGLAGGTIAAFTDDDCIVDPGWLDAVAKAFELHPEALGVQGKTITDRAAMTPFTRQVEQLEGGQPYRTCNIAYRTDVVRDLGGFDPHLIRGEDVVLGMRVLERGPIIFAPGAVVTHPPRPKEWANRAAWKTLIESEAHFKHAYPDYAPARSRTLSLQKPEHVFSRWVLLPVRRYWRWHWAYARREPRTYLRQVPRIIGEKFALFSLLPYFLARWHAPSPESRPDAPPLASTLDGTRRRAAPQRSVPPPSLRGLAGRRHTGFAGSALPRRLRSAPGDAKRDVNLAPADMLSTINPMVSVVVPTRNRAAFLPGLLAALASQDYPNYEVIVVDDASTDESNALLRIWQGERNVALRLERQGGSYRARNAGWRAARGEIIAFTDDDCLPSPTWLSGLVQVMCDPTVAGVQGATIVGSGEVTPFTHQIEQTKPGPPYRTCNIAYRRSVLRDEGGFKDDLRWYADNVLGLRVFDSPARLGFAPDAVVHHPPRAKEWRDKAAWLARFEADALYRRHLLALGNRSRIVPPRLSPAILWIARPMIKQSWRHLAYALRHPRQYKRNLPPMVREKRELLKAIAEYRRREGRGGDTLPPFPERPAVSVVIVTRGRAELLAGALAAIAQQSTPPDDVIVVEHGGNRDTRELATRYGARWRWTDASTLGEARQLGVDEAPGDVIAFTDDDCLPAPDWLERAVAAFRRTPALWGVQGRTIAETGKIGMHAVDVSHPDSLYQTCNIAYRREAIARAGGFDRGFRGWFEDTALGARVSRLGPIGWDPAIVVTHRAVPRRLLDRQSWSAILADERRLATSYRGFYWRRRGPGFLAVVTGRWLIGAPLKALIRELPRLPDDPAGYLVLVRALLRERVNLLAALARHLHSTDSSDTPADTGDPVV